MKSKYYKTITLLIIISLIGIFPSYLYPANGTFLREGDKVIVEFKGENTVVIKGDKFKYMRIKKNKRLRIINENSKEGIFVKRFGTRIRIRNLKGSLTHLIRKAGKFYKVKTVMGKELAVINIDNIDNGEITVSNLGSNSIYHVVSKDGKIVFKGKNDKVVFTLEGETNLFPASFFALTPLSLIERVACYLTYR